MSNKLPLYDSTIPTPMLPDFDPKQAWREAAERNRISDMEKRRKQEAQKLLAEIERDEAT